MDNNDKYLPVSLDPRIQSYLLTAKEKKIKSPVLVCCNKESAQARALHLELTGKRIPSAVYLLGGQEFSSFEVITRGPMAILLREHAQDAGCVLGHHLLNPLSIPDWSLVALHPDVAQLTMWKGSTPLLHLVLPYAKADTTVKLPLEIAHDPGPSCIPLETKNGSVVRVFGRTGEDAFRTRLWLK